jgi:hypothetical protein
MFGRMVMQTITLSKSQREGLEIFVSNHMMNCHMYIDNEEEFDFEPYAPYCGCEVCETREYLMSTFDYLEKIEVLRVE